MFASMLTTGRRFTSASTRPAVVCPIAGFIITTTMRTEGVMTTDAPSG